MLPSPYREKWAKRWASEWELDFDEDNDIQCELDAGVMVEAQGKLLSTDSG